eukprot:CAMPEP_0202964560 /NCGR_PEP_ID=MMETSP1396-20130829/8636_1 /ASSEMBLY_ACC=CAM_ASM_000872 /TAXON_ID= /ORGANISM="Pseudokeronopsis sp., Strain Brazil" /LENGTH=140 /DNA_ID=CAMNT_0049686747 /DNA_START=563 /DNA_END=985 /DNA_ORIENTATION=+
MVKSINVNVLYAIHSFAGQGPSSADTNPLIAISASYDSFAISPELSTSIENGGSGLIGLLELSRIFSQITNELTELANFGYDLMFILTPTSSLNYEATGKFVEHMQSNIKERIKLVICLDALSNLISQQKELFVTAGFMA